jgi:hypothetical protein
MKKSHTIKINKSNQDQIRMIFLSSPIPPRSELVPVYNAIIDVLNDYFKSNTNLSLDKHLTSMSNQIHECTTIVSSQLKSTYESLRKPMSSSINKAKNNTKTRKNTTNRKNYYTHSLIYPQES